MNKVTEVGSEKELIEVIEQFLPMLPHFLDKISSLEEYATKVCKYGRVLVIKEEEAVKGFVIFYCNDLESKKSYISLIAVSDKYRRQHVGSDLVAAVENVSKDAGMQFIRLEVDNDNEGARSFYERLGFVKVSEASESSSYMEKEV